MEFYKKITFDYKKNIYLTTGDNLYCERHKFKNEEILQDEAIVVEYKTIEDAMRVIDQAKSYSKDNNVSLSKLIERYLDSLTTKSEKKSKISPLVKSLTGVIPSGNHDDKKDYKDYKQCKNGKSVIYLEKIVI